MARDEDANSFQSGVRSGESDSSHPQDLGRPTFVFPPSEVKFDGGNMFKWSKMINLTLYDCQLGDHLTENPREETNPEYKKWKAEESLILSWMLRSMTPEIRRDFLYCDTVREMWDDIQKYSEEQTHDWCIYELNVQASQARQGGDNVLQYTSKVKAIWREIDYLWPTQNPQYVERQYILKQRLFTLLMGLNSVYELVRSQLLHREKLPGLEEAIGAIRKEESRFRVTPEPQVHNSAALLTKKLETRAASSGNWTIRPPQQSPTPGAEGEDSRDALFCNYCKKRRHTKENCWKLAWKNQNTGKKAYVSTSQPQSSGGPGPSPNVEEVQEKISSTALIQSGNPSSQEWIADTGATDHMSPAEPLFRQYTPAERQHRIQTTGEGTLPVKGVGEILLNSLGILKEVLYVEDLRANLISIQKLVDDYGWRFILDSDDCFLCDKVSGTRISSFKREGGLLLLDASPRQCLVSQLTCPKEERMTRLHQRMGHPPFDLLRTFYPSMFRGVLDKKLFCNACHKAKLRRASFTYLDDRCVSLFECKHNDVWGPCSVESLTGCRYFVIFVDDYSRTMWLYLLKSKAEVPQIIIHFCKMISNQFGNKVKRFQIDNGTEFL